MIMLNHNLHIFLSVAKNGSITETANELYISQPAVSKAIKNLESELNLKLFHRDKRKGLILTDAGNEILLQARQMADLENRMYQTAFRYNNFIGGKVRIAAVPLATNYLLAKVLHTFKTKYPFVTVELTEGSAISIKKAVEEHQVDFGISYSPFGNLDYKVIYNDHMIAVSKEPLPNGSVINLSENPQRFILCQSGKEVILENLTKNINVLIKSTVVEHASTVIALAEECNGIGIVSKLLADITPNSLIQYPIDPAIHSQIGIVAHDINDLTPVATELKRMILEFS
ncbi:LysR family transcriptional regulator [Lachnospiraceae bacterium TWA4]|nr:LysR family transcriptional regulator [Lachnospiraceae bacterium TWA4]